MTANFVFRNSQIKQKIDYTTEDFKYRLLVLQNYLKTNNLDCFLIINGSFSENNKESAKLSNWLFQGYSGQQLYYNLVLDRKFDDSIFVIGQNSISAILDPGTLGLIRSNLIAASNCYIFVPTEEEYQDK